MKTTLLCQRKQSFPYMETLSQFTHRTEINSLPKLKIYLVLRDDCRKFYTLRDDEKKLKFITNCYTQYLFLQLKNLCAPFC